MTKTSIAILEYYLGFIGCIILTAFRKMAVMMGINKDSNNASGKIVFVKFIEQGALVLHQNTFNEAAVRYGTDNIYLCTFKSNAQLVEILNLVPAKNRVYIDDSSLSGFVSSFFISIVRLKRENIDTAIDLEFFSCATAIFCYLSGAKKRAGYHRYLGLQNYRGDLFTHRHNYSHYVHVSNSGWNLLKSIEINTAELPALDIEKPGNSAFPAFTPSDSDENHLNLLLGDTSSTKEIIVINLNLNDVLPQRRWPEENFKQFIMGLSQSPQEYIFVFTGREDEYQMTQKFISGLSLVTAINLCGKTTLRDILTLYTRAKLLLTSDSGPGHLATLTRVNSIVLFGPETPELYGPLSQSSKVFYKSLPCSPCYNVYNNRQSACTNNICMKKISVQEVLKAATDYKL